MNLTAKKSPAVNLGYFKDLGDRWYTATDDPIALLRAESRFFTSWILSEIQKHFGSGQLRILDVGCGGGLLSNGLAGKNFQVTGIDLSEDALAIARKYDTTHSVEYRKMDAYCPAFPDNSFDVVCSMDFLEHVERPGEVIAQVSRVLRPGGLWFFHTFNRTWLSHLVIIKGLEWFVRNTPSHLHVHHLFIKPAELQTMSQKNKLQLRKISGIRPVFCSRAFLRLIRRGEVTDDFQFTTSRSMQLGYFGVAERYETP